MRLPKRTKKVKSKRYERLKKEYQIQLGSETLKKYKILNEAFEIGRKLKGKSYTYVTLSIDFDIPYTTCKRILSLRKASKRTWSLIRRGKISSFKAAMVLHQKHITYQDELIDIIITEDLSTYDIKNLKDGNLREVNQNRLDLAIRKGFARQHSAYNSFKVYLERVDALTLIDLSKLPPKKLPFLKKQLTCTNKNINKLLERLE